MKTVIMNDEVYRRIIHLKADMEKRDNKCYSMGDVIELILNRAGDIT